MIYPVEILPPSFNSLPSNQSDVLGEGVFQVAMNNEQFQRFQCRLGYFDLDIEFTDTAGAEPNLTHAYGDLPIPTDQFPDLKSRMLGGYSGGYDVVFEGIGTGGDYHVNINFSFEAVVWYWADNDQTPYPRVGVSGETYVKYAGSGVEQQIKFGVIPDDVSWEDFGILTLSDGSGASWDINLKRQPLAAVPDVFYELTTANAKPTQYVTA